MIIQLSEKEVDMNYYKSGLILCLVLFLVDMEAGAKRLFNREPPYVSENSLLRFGKRYYSYSGEDGIIEEILRRIDVKNGFFIEFGAGDGICLSNTKFLADKGWKGLYIEIKPSSYKKLVKNYKNYPNIKCLNQKITYSDTQRDGKTIDRIMAKLAPNQEVDVLSIDVDSFDYLILENLVMKPKLICIEGPICWSPFLNKRLPDDECATTYVSQPPEVIKQIGESKGYTLICIMGCNYFFIRNDLKAQFKDVPKDLLTLWRDYWYDTGFRHPGGQNWIGSYRLKNPVFKKYESEDFFDFPITE